MPDEEPEPELDKPLIQVDVIEPAGNDTPPVNVCKAVHVFAVPN